MKIIDTTIPDVKILEPEIFGDERGVFFETYREKWFKENIADISFVQNNHCSSKNGVLRGLHYQVDNPQAKLVRVVYGEIYDVVVDLRNSSSTIGQWFGTMLSAENRRMLWVPAGFAHGYYVTSKSAEVAYQCTDYYAPEFERCVKWNDEDLAIKWPIKDGFEPIISSKDRAGTPFKIAEYLD